MSLKVNQLGFKKTKCLCPFLSFKRPERHEKSTDTFPDGEGDENGDILLPDNYADIVVS